MLNVGSYDLLYHQGRSKSLAICAALEQAGYPPEALREAQVGIVSKQEGRSRRALDILSLAKVSIQKLVEADPFLNHREHGGHREHRDYDYE